MITFRNKNQRRLSSGEKTRPSRHAPATHTDSINRWKKDCPSNMQDVSNVQELVDALADAGDQLVIVEFYAPWCNACKALFPKICKIVADHPEVIFLKVSFEENKDMCKNMGVKVLPFFRLFQGAKGKVAEFSCTVSKIQRFRDAIEEYNGAFCSLEEPPGAASAIDVRLT